MKDVRLSRDVIGTRELLEETTGSEWEYQGTSRDGTTTFHQLDDANEVVTRELVVEYDQDYDAFFIDGEGPSESVYDAVEAWLASIA